MTSSNNSTSVYNEAGEEELDLFSNPPISTGLNKINYVHYYPINAISQDTPLEFNVTGNSSEYLNLKRSFLIIKAKILNEDGTSVGASDMVAPICLTLHSIFQQIDLSLNHKLITTVSRNHAYKAYIENILDLDDNALSSRVQSSMWYPDSAGFFNSTSQDGGNLGFLNRYSITAGSKPFEMVGGLHCDVAQQNKLILHGVHLNIKCWLNDPKFFLVANDSTKKYKLQILEAKFKCCKVIITPSLMLAHAELLKTDNAIYYYRKTVVQNYAIQRGQYQFLFDDLFTGHIPSLLIIGFVSNDAYNGHFQKNPLEFLHKDLDSISVEVDNLPTPYRQPLKMNFSDSNYIEAYHNIFIAIKKDQTDSGIIIKRTDFDRGFSLFAFDLSATTESFQYSPSKKGSVKIVGGFANALDESLTAIVYAKFDTMFQIDLSRSIITS